MASKEGRVLLPAAVKPQKYKLTLEPFLDPPKEGQKPEDVFAFDGHVDIIVKVSEPVDYIEVHLNEIEIKSVVVKSASETIEVTSQDPDAKKQTVKLRLAKKITPGEYTVCFKFKGHLNDKMAGFYRSGYKDHVTGEQKYMAVTQFEPTDARRSFPCFDEPALKAVFEISLIAPKHLDCLSNTQVKSVTEREDGKKIVSFEPTPLLSTYLIAYCVGEYDYVEDKTPEGVLIRVYTLKNKSHQGKFGLDVGVKTLSFFTKFFEIPYMLNKLDMIAIPDFSAGAMENQGLVTFRETALLLDPENSSAGAKSRVAEVVAHELAHQWFGNLCTMEWWTDLWLNEGFATWAADLAVDTLFPDWETWVQFVGGTFSGALRLDALRSSHPIEVDVKAAQEVNEIFDHISYFKGASVIRMLADYLSVEVFRKGLVVYLNRFKFGNAVTDDLWKALEEVSGKPISSVMTSWTRQTGYPVLRVDKAGSNKISCNQIRFLSAGALTDEDKQTKWMVPISYISAATNEAKKVLMDGRDLEMEVNTSGWLKLNQGQSGVYRVCYPHDMYIQFIEPIRKKTLGVVDRLGLLMDVMALARAGIVPTSSALDILAAFTEETDYTCVSNVISSLSEIEEIFGQDEECTKKIRALGRNLLKSAAAYVGWDAKPNDAHVVSLLRTTVLTALQNFDDESVIAESKVRFNTFLKDSSSLPADLRIPVYFAAVKAGGDQEFDAVIALHDKSDLNEEKVRCIRALGNTTHVHLLEKLLTWGTAHVRAQDLMYVMAGVANNPKGYDFAWNYLKEQWGNWIKKYGSGNFMLTRFMELGTKGFCAESKAVEVEAYFKTVETTGVDRKLAQCLEGIRVRAAWVERDAANVKQWLQAYHA